MSLGFGFSLPALVPYGAGGNNPFNQSGPTLDLSFMGNAGNLSGADTYTLDTNFITPQYQVAAQYAVWVDGSGMTQRNFADIVTFTRGSAATQFDSTGTLIYAPMNAIRNNMMVGAVAGTPGTNPTNWGVTAIGLTQTIVGTGTENGITYIDIRLNGTTTGQFGNVRFEPNNGPVAAAGQSWAASAYLKLVAGSLTNIAEVGVVLYAFTSGSVFISSTQTASAVSASLTRFSHVGTMPATTGFVQPAVYFNTTAASGQAVDFTIRIGMPQLELGSTATAVNATSGTAYYGPRFDYNPATLAAQGLLIEEQRTNSIRNNTMQGAVAGTPGTLPTNWVLSGLGTLTQQVVGTGTVNGITYIDLRFSGTTSTTQLTIRFEPNGTGGIPAANGQTWSASQWSAVIAGSLSNITGNGVNANLWDAAGNFVGGALLVGLNTTATLTRVSGSGTIATVGTAFIQPQIFLTFNSGVAIDITLRIGLPQLELGAFATSVIPTTTTALTRSADVASVNTLSPWYNATEGTLFAEGSVGYTVPGSAFPLLASLNDGTANNRIETGYLTATLAGFEVAVGGVVQANIYPATVAATRKVAGAYKANDFAACVNGGAVGTDTAGSLPVVDRLRLGDRAGNNINGYLRRITYYPRRLPNADLQTITA